MHKMVITYRKYAADTDWLEIDTMQFGFTPGKGITDAIFTILQMQEEYGSKGRGLRSSTLHL